jgi:hypothetical protein
MYSRGTEAQIKSGNRPHIITGSDDWAGRRAEALLNPSSLGSIARVESMFHFDI